MLLGTELASFLHRHPWLSLQLEAGECSSSLKLSSVFLLAILPREVSSLAQLEEGIAFASLFFCLAGWMQRRKHGEGSIFPGSMGSLRDDQREAR